MQRHAIICLIGCLLFAATTQAATADPGALPNTLLADQTALTLNGAGMRTKFFLDMYAAGLYLATPETDPQLIISQDAPMTIRLHIVSSLITAEKMSKATMEGFIKSTHGNISAIEDRVRQFIAIFALGVKENDKYDLVFLPDQGVAVLKNEVLMDRIPGLDFKQALFGIWLGDQPAQQSLKQAMLGR